MQCPACGFATTEFKSFNQAVGHGVSAIHLRLRGNVCANCGDAVLESKSYQRLTAAQNKWVDEHNRSETLRLRQQLNVTQRELAELMGIGTLAVSRYERGTTTPAPTFLRLLRAMVKHPNIMADLRAN